jgi:hypothetical protein
MSKNINSKVSIIHKFIGGSGKLPTVELYGNYCIGSFPTEDMSVKPLTGYPITRGYIRTTYRNTDLGQEFIMHSFLQSFN